MKTPDSYTQKKRNRWRRILMAIVDVAYFVLIFAVPCLVIGGIGLAVLTSRRGRSAARIFSSAYTLSLGAFVIAFIGFENLAFAVRDGGAGWGTWTRLVVFCLDAGALAAGTGFAYLAARRRGEPAGAISAITGLAIVSAILLTLPVVDFVHGCSAGEPLVGLSSC